MPNDNTTLYVRDIDPDVKRKFKALCARQGTSIAEKVRTFLRKEVERDDEKAGGRKTPG